MSLLDKIKDVDGEQNQQFESSAIKKFVSNFYISVCFCLEKSNSFPNIKYSELKVKPKEKVSSPQDVVEYLKNKIGFCPEENLYAIFLNASNKVLKFEKISKGTTARSAVYPEEIAKEALNAGRTRSIIVAHNHPGGVCKPSQNDIIATEAIQKALKTISVLLLDHIIVTDTDYYSFKDNGLI